MPIYQWKARTRQGTLKKGEIEAVNDQAVMPSCARSSSCPSR